MTTLQRNGNVLIPTDSAGRVLELLMLLDQHWTYNNLCKFRWTKRPAYSLAFLSHAAYSSIEFAQGQLEWMSDNLIKQFENSRENPFDLRWVFLSDSSWQIGNALDKYVRSGNPSWANGCSSINAWPWERILFGNIPRMGQRGQQHRHIYRWHIISSSSPLLVFFFSLRRHRQLIL